MTELEDAFRSILTDPCNRGAERRNWANVRNALEIINNTIINEGDVTNIVEGDTLVLFEVVSDAYGLPTAPVQQLLWDGSTWLRNGDTFTAYDWSTSQMFRANFLQGMQGVGVKRPDIAADALEIITVEGLARFIQVRFETVITAGTATATVLKFCGAYPNVHDPGATITVYDRTTQGTNIVIGDYGVCVWDEVNFEYVLLTNKVAAPTVATTEVGIVKITDGAIGTCLSAPWNAFCVWPAKLQVPALGATLCGDPWSAGIDVWVVDMRACSPPAAVTNGERFLAYNTNQTYEPDALGSRPLFVIKSDEQSVFVSPTAVIRIASPSEGTCVPIEADADCLFYGVIQVAAGVTPNACNIWLDGAACWAVAINVCKCVAIRPHVGERYLAYKVSDAWGPLGDVRALYVFRHSEVTRTAVVEITSSEADCKPSDPSACLWDAKVIRVPNDISDWCEPWEDANDAVKVVEVNHCETSPTLKSGERYIGHWVGVEDTKNVFAVQTVPTSTNEVRWGRCVTAWYNSGSNCDYVAVQEIKGCDDFSLIDFNEADPNYEDDFPTYGGGTAIGYRVLLPIAEVAPGVGTRDPNLEPLDVIGFRKTSDGAYVCVTDYLDDAIGTVKMFARDQAKVGHGWGLMDGVTNKVDGGWSLGSGFSMIGKFPRHPDGTNPDPLINPYGVLGAAGGRRLIPECDLMHVHESGDSASSCAYVVDHIYLQGVVNGDQVDVFPDPLMEADPVDICGILNPPVGSDYCHLQRCGDCTKEQPYDVNQRHTDFEIVIEEPPSTKLCGGWGDTEAEDIDPLPVAAPGQACAAGDPFGPLNIMNPYRNLYFIERLDNSQRHS